MRLELRQLTAAYGDTTALRNVSVIVPDGSAVAVVGPNGAGKTTLLSVAAGVLQPRSGDVRLGDDTVTGDSVDSRARRGMCYITEGRAVFRSLTVRENLRLFAVGLDDAEVTARAVEAFPRLGQRLSQVAGTMSGGEQQMLALARAYGRRAPLVLLDEVSMGLAPNLVDEIFAFLQQLHAEGTTLLVIEQYVTRALELADYVYVLSRGRVTFAGRCADVAGEDLVDRYLASSASG